jgi:hypothetical protein
MVEPTVRSIVAAASEDHDADPETVFAAVVAGLRFACKECGCSDCGSDGGCSCKDCSSCGSKQSKLAHNGCTGEGCKFCENKFGQKDEEKDESDDMDVTAAVKWAVEVDTGDTFWSERVDLPKADASGLSSEGTPKIDKGRVPKDGLSAVDVPSSAHPSEMQDVAEKADYDTQTDQGANAKPDSTKAPVERVKADTPMQPEHHKAPRTKTWNGTEGLGLARHVRSGLWRSSEQCPSAISVVRRSPTTSFYAYWRTRCRACVCAGDREYRSSLRPETVARRYRDVDYRRKYGISLDDYEQMVKATGR